MCVLLSRLRWEFCAQAWKATLIFNRIKQGMCYHRSTLEKVYVNRAVLPAGEPVLCMRRWIITWPGSWERWTQASLKSHVQELCGPSATTYADHCNSKQISMWESCRYIFTYAYGYLRPLKKKINCIPVIVKCKSEEFFLFEVEVGGHQVEEFVWQQLRLCGEEKI